MKDGLLTEDQKALFWLSCFFEALARLDMDETIGFPLEEFKHMWE